MDEKHMFVEIEDNVEVIDDGHIHNAHDIWFITNWYIHNGPIMHDTLFLNLSKPINDVSVCKYAFIPFV